MSNGAREATGGATYRMLRELGCRAQHSYAAIREPHEIVVTQRFVRVRTAAHVALAKEERATPVDGEAMALLLRDARCLAKNWHPNVARVRHVDLVQTGDMLRTELTIASELLEGTTLEDLTEAAHSDQASTAGSPLGVAVLARILLDVLVGLHALHTLRDAMAAPLGAIHGELCPANVVVGKDGITRLVNVLRKRPVRVALGSEAVGYAAPEALDTGGTDDARSDIYAVGVMLWEGLAGRRLYDEVEPSRVLARQREGELAQPPVDPSSPFARLADVAMRALSFDPALRFRGASEMAAELRSIAGIHLAAGGAVAARVVALTGERIRTRRAMLDPATSGTRRRATEQEILAAAADLEQRSAARSSATTVRASARRVAPTLEKEVSLDLIAASRRSIPEPIVSTIEEDDYAFADDDDLPGPRASSPELVDFQLDLGQPASTEAIIARALSTTTAQMRAVAVERADPPARTAQTETPNDFVIPIEVTATLHEGSPRRRGRARHAAIAAAAAIALVGIGAFVALRPAPREVAASAPVAVPVPVPVPVPLPLPVAVGDDEPKPASPTATTTATASATASAAPPPRLAPRPAAPRASAPPPAPKKSVYEPDGL
jgi:serine/threonine-protein kinase